MTALEEVPQSVYRAIVLGISVYFVLLVVGYLGQAPLALVTADVTYGAIAMGIGVLLYARAASTSPLVMGSAAALILGGLAQFFWIATGESTFDLFASTLVFVGLGGYLVAIAIAN